MKSVKLMLTCLCDAFYGEVAIATVKVLETVGYQVEFDDRQTCCGQPPFNAGDWSASRQIAKHAIAVLLSDDRPLVTPSGSCAAMMREGYPMLFPEMAHPSVFELSEFLSLNAEVTAWPHAVAPRKVAFHRACHGRAIGIGNRQIDLVRSIPGIELVRFNQEEQCCGFGGAFSATHGAVSASIGLEKLKNVQESGATEIVSGDMGCLMQLRGLIERHQIPLKTTHFAQLMAEGVTT